MKTIVQIESFPSVFNISLQKHLLKNNSFLDNCNLVVVDIEDQQREYSEAYRKTCVGISAVISKIRYISNIQYWIGFNRYLEGKYNNLYGDIVNIQFIIWEYIFLLPFLTKHFEKIVLSFWGSDILRNKKRILRLEKKLFERAGIITYISDDMKTRFMRIFGEKYLNKMRKVDFGSEILDYIDNIDDFEISMFKQKHGIPNGKKCLVIGYNRYKTQQHIATIKSLIESKTNAKEYFLVFPWNYGSEDNEYLEQIENIIRGVYNYSFIKNRLTDREVACLRKVTDILIQTQTTDAMSSTMLETIYAGKEVITGRWLHYDELDRAGVQLCYVDSVNEVGSAIQEITLRPLSEKVKACHKEIVRKMIGWEYRINDWLDIYLAE